jgi:hypothetical protein
MIRCGWLAACVLAFAAFPAFARTWNDTEGHTYEGEFVRVLKGKVVINVAGRMIPIPFGHLIQEDQDFVREELEKHGLGGQLPARKKPATGSSTTTKSTDKDASTANDPKPGPTRTWTDVQGRSIQARFIGMEGAKVVLQFKKTRTTYPFDKFSLADQRYVRDEMTGRGEGDKVPAEVVPAQPGPAAHQFAQAQPPAGPMMPRGMPAIPRPSMPAMPQIPHITFPPIPTPAPVQPPPMVAPTFPQHVQPPPMTPMPAPNPMPSFANDQPVYQQVMVKKCMSCGQVVPNNLTAGDRCPHCGVYFNFDQTNGKTAHWAYFATPGGIGAIVAVIVGLIVRARRSS